MLIRDLILLVTNIFWKYTIFCDLAAILILIKKIKKGMFLTKNNFKINKIIYIIY